MRASPATQRRGAPNNLKSITQAHDGTLTLTARSAGGLQVTVELPIGTPNTARPRLSLARLGR